MINGAAWLFGDNIDTDVLAPGYLMKLSPEELAKQCLVSVDPDFANAVQCNDIVVGGENFGLGSSREQAAISLKLLGVGCVLATSFARIFYRNAINIGLPALVIPKDQGICAQDELEIDLTVGTVQNLSSAQIISTSAIPPHLLEMIEAGGLITTLKKKLGHKQVHTAKGYLS